MADDNDFLIEYKGVQVNVSPVNNDGNIYFIIHLSSPVIIAEGMINENWEWYESGGGVTELSAQLGAIIEATDE